MNKSASRIRTKSTMINRTTLRYVKVGDGVQFGPTACKEWYRDQVQEDRWYRVSGFTEYMRDVEYDVRRERWQDVTITRNGYLLIDLDDVDLSKVGENHRASYYLKEGPCGPSEILYDPGSIRDGRHIQKWCPGMFFSDQCRKKRFELARYFAAHAQPMPDLSDISVLEEHQRVFEKMAVQG